ncbi:MAG: ABC transporter substrate-binding protein [Spirochaetales bacterium]
MKKRILALALLLTLVSAQALFAETPARGGILKMTPSKQGVLPKNFNPFSPAALESAVGCIYETLIYFNNADGTANPWLAESWKWSSDLKEITFTIRPDIKFNDGSALSADDVAFSAMLGKTNKALDMSGLWSEGLESVTANGNKVSFKFASVNVTTLEKFGGLFVVPKAVWSKVQDPLTWTGNDTPVGSGPFMLDPASFNEQAYKLVRNPIYWQKGADGKPLPYIDGIQYISTTNEQIAFKLMNGEYDWAGYSLPNVDAYVAANPDNKYWFPEGNLVFLYMNNLKAPFDNPNVRKAFAAAISQKDITRKMSPSPVPADMTAVKKSFSAIAADGKAKYNIAYDKAKARKLLEGEGYKLNAKGLYEKNGKELSFKLFVPTDWTDWIGAAETVASMLKDIGVEAVITQSAWPVPFQTSLETGDYDMAVSFITTGTTPYYQFNRWLYSANYAGLGEKAKVFSNMRYKNADIDKNLEAYRSEPNAEKQKAYMSAIVSQFMKDTPCVPMFFNPTWFEYTTRNFVGWPSADDPYAWPSVIGMQKMPILLAIHKK